MFKRYVSIIKVMNGKLQFKTISSEERLSYGFAVHRTPSYFYWGYYA